MAKTVIDAPRGRSPFKVLPEDVTVITAEGHPLYDERVHEPVDEALATDMDENGNSTPIILWRDGDRLVLVAGRRRVKAALLIQKRRKDRGEDAFRLQAFVESGDVRAMQRLMYVENSHRKDLSPVQRARQMHRAINRFSWSEEEVAAAFACDPATVKNTLKLLDAAPEVQAAVGAEISAATARDLSDLPREKQTEVLAEMRAKGTTRGIKAKRAVKTAKTGKAQPAIDRPKRPMVKRLIAAGVTEGNQTDKAVWMAVSWVLGLTSKDAMVEAYPHFEAIVGLLEGEKAKRRGKKS